MASSIFNWENDPATPLIEFTVSPHEMNTDTINLWIDLAQPKPTNAIASLTLSLEDAHQLGVDLIAAVEQQRALRPRWVHDIGGDECGSEIVYTDTPDGLHGVCDDHDRKVSRKP